MLIVQGSDFLASHPIIHYSLQSASSVHKVNASPCWSANMGVSMCRSSENIAYRFIITFPAVLCRSCLDLWKVSGSRAAVLCIALRIYSKQYIFLCSFSLSFFPPPCILLASRWCIHTEVLTAIAYKKSHQFQIFPYNQ